MMKIKSLSVIIKPTHECNLACKYCYVGEDVERGKMDISLVRKSIEEVSKFSENSSWIWHGGEPLLMGVDFFKEVKKIQQYYKKRGIKFSNGIQTNGTLISEELLEFIQSAKDFHLGLSLDGPEEINNRTRVDKKGVGAYAKIMGGIEMMKKRNFGTGAICVINSKNIGHPEELYDFFKSKNINVKFNPLIISGNAKINFEELSITPKEYSLFLSKMFEIYNKDSINSGTSIIEVDPIIESLGNLLIKRPFGCNYSTSCRENFISIGPLGDIYPCGRFDGDKKFWMGNVKNNTIEEAVQSPINLRLKKRYLENIPQDCGKCNFEELCHSGCMHNAYLSGNVGDKDPYCIAYKKLYSLANNLIENERNKSE